MEEFGMYPIQIRHVHDNLLQFYTGLIDLTDIRPDHDPSNYFLTRSLAAFSLQSLVGISPEIAVKAITDGYHDNGIDAIYFDGDNNELYFVQSKWNYKGNKTPEDGEVKKFTDGIRDIIEFRFDHFNEKIKKQEQELKRLISKPGIKIRIILTHTGVGLSDYATRTLNRLIDDQNMANEDDTAQWINVDLKKLHRVVLGESAYDPINIDGIILNEWAMKDKPIKSFYGRITGDQLANWWNTYGDRLFAKNIRHLLHEGDVHKEISKTIDTEPSNFWYFNNGITMICDSVEKATAGGDRRDFGIFECKNVYIINGAQTVGTIGRYLQRQQSSDQEDSEESNVRLEDIEVLVRIISVGKEEADSSEKFAQQLTKANNRQNKIENRDFVTLDENQKRIAQELSFYSITYNYKRSTEEKAEENIFGLIESTEALSYAYHDVDAATLIHREPGKVWENIEHSRYRRLFNTGLSSFYVWNTVTIYREIKQAIEIVKEKLKNEPEAVLTHGDHFVSHLIFTKIGPEKINKEKMGLDDLLNDVNLEELVEFYAIEVANESKNYENTISGIFKTYTIPRELKEKILEKESHRNPEEQKESHVGSIDSLIEIKFREDRPVIRNRISNFDEKLSGDTIAEKGFTYWLNDLYNPLKHECGVVSNIHQYLKGDGKKDQRFILRIKYDNGIVVEFSHSSYGTDYVSLLFANEDFQQWLSNKADEKGRLTIKDDGDLGTLEELKIFFEAL
ncbi:AIPR family protein [Bacillus sp. FJAT-50079]|uniref:AIPR family protein n=1 Tax=Bacillus sp. FJAT-50079 TaxID=2833577 RepID=UPI001BCA623C|nr:AIPR family protein [Bacillus sp. FJAT-50079]MBS4207129.1 AIPR family protein [Bacillus sp. FJAT-50079]